MSTPLWLDRNLNKSVLLVKRMPDGMDEYGNITYTDFTVATKGFLRPIAGTDLQFGRAGVGSFILVLPAEVAGHVDGFASFVIDGITYEADGPGEKYTALHQTELHHVEIAVTRSSA